LLGDVQFMLGCLVGFLDEAMQNDDALPDQCAEKCSANAFSPFGAYFECTRT
jgi:hypothetical protein